MTPDSTTLQSAALAFVREVRGAAAQTALKASSKDKQQDVPLRVNRELAVDIIRTQRYQHRDEISLILEAREYIRERLPVHDRTMAVAVLLQRDAVCVGLMRIRVVGV